MVNNIGKIALKQISTSGSSSGSLIGYDPNQDLWVPTILTTPVEQVDDFIATAAQTSFTLTETPTDSDDVRMYINGVNYDLGVDYAVTGTGASWLNTDFSLESGDEVKFVYEFGGFYNTGSAACDCSGTGGGESYDVAGPFSTDQIVSISTLTLMKPAGSALTATLPQITTENKGKTVEIKAYSGSVPGASMANVIVIEPSGSDTIDEDTVFSLSKQRESITLRSDGISDWVIV